MTIALYTGSFDPVHLGHLGVIEQAARSFEEVVVAVLGNPAKVSGLLSIDERVRLLDAATAHLDNVRCASHAGLAVDAARAHGATTLVRAAHKEQRNELTMAAHNERIAGIPTTIVGGDPGLGWVSSSVVRQLLADGDDARVR
ncbi:MAG TPA: adenylyltransferase/cytidyltransferase family protein, partial [Acidimicrobiales bacterium]|nr:adenylyltransferase/cytidyltransferase family protein [Acidimicrobiales bacterium]